MTIAVSLVGFKSLTKRHSDSTRVILLVEYPESSMYSGLGSGSMKKQLPVLWCVQVRSNSEQEYVGHCGHDTS